MWLQLEHTHISRQPMMKAISPCGSLCGTTVSERRAGNSSYRGMRSHHNPTGGKGPRRVCSRKTPDPVRGRFPTPAALGRPGSVALLAHLTLYFQLPQPPCWGSLVRLQPMPCAETQPRGGRGLRKHRDLVDFCGMSGSRRRACACALRVSRLSDPRSGSAT